MKQTGVKLTVPIAGPVCGRTHLLMPDGTEVPGVVSVRMVYDADRRYPVCTVELHGVEIVHEKPAP